MNNTLEISVTAQTDIAASGMFTEFHAAKTSSQVQTAITESEVDQSISVISRAFSTDPAARWVYPDLNQYFTYFPRFIQAFGGGAFEQQSAHYLEGFPAAALWLPPGIGPDDAKLMSIIEESVPPGHRASVLALFDEMGSYHPDGPHWHLPLIGTDPAWQGKGCGSILLKYALPVCDEQETLAYLEASSERSVPLYQRHGFELLGTIQVGSSPPLFPMVRKPRPLKARGR